MNLLKLFIPSGDEKVVTELESFTVSWKVKTGWGDATQTHSKVFIDKEEANEFKNQLENSAKFIKAYISTEMYKN